MDPLLAQSAEGCIRIRPIHSEQQHSILRLSQIITAIERRASWGRQRQPAQCRNRLPIDGLSLAGLAFTSHRSFGLGAARDRAREAEMMAFGLPCQARDCRLKPASQK